VGTWFFLPKSLGGSRLSGKIAWGGSPYFGFYTFIAFLLTSVLEFACGGYYIYPPPPPPLIPPVCIYAYISFGCFQKKILDEIFISIQNYLITSSFCLTKKI
jgi:hypothetical protein